MSEKDFTIMHSRNMQQVSVTQRITKVLTLFITYAFLIVMALIVLFPFYWMIISSLKSLDEYRASVPTFWPRMVLISNYADAFSTGNLGRLFLNTAYVGIVSTMLSLIITILTAFAFARLEFKGKNALVGEVVSIDSAWSDEYQNITVTIVCDGLTEQPIQCYRLSGEGAQALEVGSVVGVYGTIKNYKGTVEFDKGCVTVPADSVASVRLAVSAYALEAGLSMNDASTMTGVITSIDTAWSDEYKNITVTIVPGGLTDYAVQCYRLSGEGAETLAVGDTITVSGTIKNYKGTIEFDKGCTLDAVVKAE